MAQYIEKDERAIRKLLENTIKDDAYLFQDVNQAIQALDYQDYKTALKYGLDQDDEMEYLIRQKLSKLTAKRLRESVDAGSNYNDFNSFLKLVVSDRQMTRLSPSYKPKEQEKQAPVVFDISGGLTDEELEKYQRDNPSPRNDM